MMFNKSYNRAVLRVRVETVTPLLIRAGDAGLDPTVADLTCVRTRHALQGSTSYIPGSSLKGVLRASAEASVRDQEFKHPSLKGACDPLHHATSCGEACKEKNRDASKRLAPEVHRHHCLACRLFGSLAMKGRASVRDLFPWDERGSGAAGPGGDNQLSANRLEVRHGVSINRVSGSVQNGPFDQEMVPAGVSFWGEIALENYQVWQLGLLARAFDELNDGFAQLGSTKSRGLGVATIAVDSILHEQVAGKSDIPAGAGELADPQDRDAYGLLPERTLPPAAAEARGLAKRFVVAGAGALAWLEVGRQALGGL